MGSALVHDMDYHVNYKLFLRKIKISKIFHSTFHFHSTWAALGEGCVVEQQQKQ